MTDDPRILVRVANDAILPVEAKGLVDNCFLDAENAINLLDIVLKKNRNISFRVVGHDVHRHGGNGQAHWRELSRCSLR